MQTKLSTKGQVVLPGPVRRKLGLRPGDVLEAKVTGASVVLTPHHRVSRKAKIVTDPITGLPVLSVDSNAPQLTSAEVDEILSNFP